MGWFTWSYCWSQASWSKNQNTSGSMGCVGRNSPPFYGIDCHRSSPLGVESICGSAAEFSYSKRMAAMRRFSGSAAGISVKARIFGDPIAAGVECGEEVPKVGWISVIYMYIYIFGVYHKFKRICRFRPISFFLVRSHFQLLQSLVGTCYLQGRALASYSSNSRAHWPDR